MLLLIKVLEKMKTLGWDRPTNRKNNVITYGVKHIICYCHDSLYIYIALLDPFSKSSVEVKE